jgi:AraC family transcriptional regulator
MGGFRLTEFAQPAHRCLPWHEHAATSLCFVVSGHYVERMRGREHECPPRSVVFKPAAERHADVFGRDGARCLLIEIMPSRLESIEPYADITTRPGLARTAGLAGLGRRIHREFTRGDGLSPLAVEGLILEVLVEASRAEPGTSSRAQPAWLVRARDLIHESLDQPLTLSSVARQVGIHPAHLARSFRAHHQRTIGDYIRRLRIERAARELADGWRPIAEISARSGFCDQSHFSRVFRQQTGFSPAAFRASTRGHSGTAAQRSC